MSKRLWTPGHYRWVFQLLISLAWTKRQRPLIRNVSLSTLLPNTTIVHLSSKYYRKASFNVTSVLYQFWHFTDFDQFNNCEWSAPRALHFCQNSDEIENDLSSPGFFSCLHFFVIAVKYFIIRFYRLENIRRNIFNWKHKFCPPLTRNM